MTANTPLRVVVDTNVATTAEGMNEAVSIECVAACGAALQRVMNEGHVFVDGMGADGAPCPSAIIAEYRANLSRPGQRGAGSRFLKWLLQREWSSERVTRVPITPSPDDDTRFAELPEPEDGTRYDPSDRKFLAVAAAADERPPVLQAMDSKWWGWRHALEANGVILHFVCPEEIEEAWRRKLG